MSKKTVFISVTCMLLTALIFYFFVFKYVVPNAAKLSIPYTWRNMPLMQDSSVVHAYLGEPTNANENKSLTESWLKGTKDQQYLLTIQYSETSKLAVSYRIEYHFKKWLIQNEYVLETKDNRN